MSARPTTISAYAAKYGRPTDNFAAACYDQNTVTELIAALTETADPTDCKTWGIDAEEWTDGVYAALRERARLLDNNIETLEPGTIVFDHMSGYSIVRETDAGDKYYEFIGVYAGEVTYAYPSITREVLRGSCIYVMDTEIPYLVTD